MISLIHENPKILGGQPIVRGTRIPVSRVLALMGMNYTVLRIKRELPDLKRLTNQDFVKILNHFQAKIAQ
ncbi:MAG: DUF433 domain-containing protein [Patescibacteria group bacterium]